MNRIHITAVINLHNEGYLCKPSLDSIVRNVHLATSNNINVDTIIILDNPDELTLKFIRSYKRPEWRIFEINVNDLGLARNFAAHMALADNIAYLDGDDIWCQDWLLQCVHALNRNVHEIVLHPEYNIYFGDNTKIMRHIDMDDSNFDILSLLFSNLWTALACTRRDIVLNIPYPKTDLRKKIGYEDWSWNIRTIEKGILHKIIYGTAHAIRIKTGHKSLVNVTTESGSAPAPNKLFRKLLRNNQLTEKQC